MYRPSDKLSGSQAPISVGRLLADVAVQADRTTELKDLVASCKADSTTQVGGHVLLTHLGLAKKDLPMAKTHLLALAEQVKAQPIASNVDIACHAVIQAIELDDQLMHAALPIVDVALPVVGLWLERGN